MQSAKWFLRSFVIVSREKLIIAQFVRPHCLFNADTEQKVLSSIIFLFFTLPCIVYYYQWYHVKKNFIYFYLFSVRVIYWFIINNVIILLRLKDSSQWKECRWLSAKRKSLLQHMQLPGSLSWIYKQFFIRVKWGAAHCSKVSDE